MTRNTVSLASALLLGTGILTVAAVAQDDRSDSVGLGIAHAYIEAMESGDLDNVSALFLDGDRSSILENASDEGSWEHYFDHHLKPEMESTQNFEITIAKESEEQFGDTILVRQTGSFSVEAGDETREFRVAVTYVIVNDHDQPKIAHLHWSSRPKRRAEPHS